MTKKLYVKTYGCQMNVYDSGRMVDLLRPLGYTPTSTPEDADIAILNTCHIREKAEQKVYSDLGRLRQYQRNRREKGDDLLIGVGGCVAQAEGEEIIRQAPYVSMVFGPQAYHQLPEMVTKILRSENRKAVHIEFPVESKFDVLPLPEESPTSAFLSIQEGCDKFCTFCVVPYTRGAESSRPADQIKKEAERLVEKGAREITLLGQNVNAYHGAAPAGKGEWGLASLIRFLAEIPNLDRIRYTTSHPRDVDDDLIRAHKDVPSLMPFLHLPVQSGSNRILKAMNRKHTVDLYLKIIDDLRSSRPEMAFSSDFIIGFPGETETDHEETIDLIKRVGYAQAYSFKYSARPGTPASVMDNQVDESIKSDRLQKIQTLLTQQQKDFNVKSIGTLQPVLLDRKGKKEGQLVGKTPHMQSVPVFTPNSLLGAIVKVRIHSATASSITGEIEPLSEDDHIYLKIARSQ